LLGGSGLKAACDIGFNFHENAAWVLVERLKK